MNLRRLFCLSGLLLASAMGCCHSRCVSSDPCDPCGGSPCGRRYVSSWKNNKVESWRNRNHGRNYGWNDVGCGCDVCGMGFEGEMMSSDCASGNCGGSMSSGSPAGCACGQHHGDYAPTMQGTMTPQAAPVLAPMPAPAPPVGNEAAPAPVNSDPNSSTAIPRSLSTQPQQVSVEEFHRLPGVIVAGPSSSSVPSVAASASSVQPVMAAPQLSSVPAPPRALPGAQQVNWVPSKQ